MSLTEKIILLLCVSLISFVSFQIGIDVSRERGCERFNGVYVGGHCLKPDTLMFPRGH